MLIKLPLRTTETLASLDCYACLEIDRAASPENIKNAYRKLLLLYHPDKNPPEDCKGGFLVISKAYEILYNKNSRRIYDLTVDKGNTELSDYMEVMRNDSSQMEAEIERRRNDFNSFKAELRNIIHQNLSEPSEPVVMPDVPEYETFNNQLGDLLVATATFHKKFMQSQIDSPTSSKQNGAKNNVSFEVTVAIEEIIKWKDQLIKNKDKPVSERQMISKKVTLNQLTEICSRLKQGLLFVASNGTPFHCDTWNHGQKESVNYDIETHKANMVRLAEIAPSLKGSGWKTLRASLLILAGLMLVAVGILAAIPTVGTSLTVALCGVAILSAGASFFVGRDTGIAGAVGRAKDALKSEDLDANKRRIN